MLTKKQLEIFGIFAKNVFAEYTFQDIKKKLQLQSHSLLQSTVKVCLLHSLLKVRTIGYMKLYRLNWQNPIVFTYLELHAQSKLPKFASLSLQEVLHSLPSHVSFFVVLLFGSYAKGSFTPTSDLDIAIIVPSQENVSGARIALQSASNRVPLKIDYHIITEEELREMLSVSYDNLGKQLVSENLPIFSSAIFYNIVFTTQINGKKTPFRTSGE